MAHCQGCGHHHRNHEARCQAIEETETGGARRCTCPKPNQEQRTAS